MANPMIPFFEEENFGEWLRETRRTLLLSQRALAKAVGVTPATISMLERGVHDPSKATVRKIRDGLEALASEKAAIAKGQTDHPTMGEGKEEFAAWLKDSREKLSLSQRELAREAGVTPATISLLERGVNMPSRKTYLKIMQALKDYSERQLTAARALRGEAPLSQAATGVPASFLAQEIHNLTEAFIESQGLDTSEAAKAFASVVRRLADRLADYEIRLGELERSFRETAADRGKEIQESFFRFLDGLGQKLDHLVSKK